MLKTSQTHPIKIDNLPVPGTRGIIGLTMCPGKRIESLFGGTWERCLEEDLEAIKEWGAEAILTLLEHHELEMMEVSELPEKARLYGIALYHLEITDMMPPDQRFQERWEEVGPALRRILSNGGKVLIHCRGGLGRTGTIAAQLLVDFGVKNRDAIRMVRNARPGSIQTREQEEYVLNHVRKE
jgi:protein-tyrosine phosphatase